MASLDNQLYIDSVEFSYTDSVPVLTGVHIQCDIGEIVGLLGRNGCGKSTLLKIIFGIIKPKNAFIRINNKKYNKGYLSKNICYLPQHNFLPNYLHIDEIIKLMVKDSSKQNALLEQDEIISKIRNQKVADLSGGEKRYVELMVLLQQDADFYLLDEPFSGVAPYMQVQIQQIILTHSKDKGFIISDHHYHSVLAITTRIVLLQNGGCRKIESKKDLEMFYVPEGTFDE
ncbi:MAG: ATP-binding cassette domain-containing protein [Sphingobacterium composti]|uniref:ATP-binding cassette domain-containing protein n=1 Tax=Sphingobacterium composti TaxID=363260 RepID=UPI00135B8A81|nr:ATP-binding cassette domain-containing protein [Sphingobacterium composti Ten et al. 2007 non Yoo et al. 2007]